jgi:hypothetical protein
MPITHATTTGIIGATQWNEAHDLSLFTPSEIGAVSGAGTAGRIAEFSDSDTIQAANLIAPSANILTLTNTAAATLALNITAAKTLTLTAADDYTLTIPATGTAALLGTANVFTTQQMVDGTSNQIQFRVQGHSTQTANLQTWERSTGVVTSGVDMFGRIFSHAGTSIDNFFTSLAGVSTATGIGNVGIGSFALDALTDGEHNFGLGYGSLSKVTTGNYNVGIGNSAGINIVGSSRNIAIGFFANSTGNGSGNTTIGNQSARFLTGSDVIFIGAWSGYNQTTLSNLLIIDNQQRASAAVEITNSIINGVMGATPSVQTLRLNAVSTIAVNTTTTNAPLTVFDLTAYVSTAATGFANGGGVRQTFTAETATDGTSQLMANITSTWIDSTNATRKAKLSLSAYDTAARLGIEIEASGTEAKLGFYGVSPIARAVLATGAGASVDDVITALQNLGLVKQS